MTGREGPGPERPGPDYPPEWDLEPDECHDLCARLTCEWCPGHDLAVIVDDAIDTAP